MRIALTLLATLALPLATPLVAHAGNASHSGNAYTVERSHGVAVYRGVPVQPNARAIAAYQQGERIKARDRQARRDARARLDLMTRQTEAFESLADSVADLSRPAPRPRRRYGSGGYFFNGYASNFPLIPTQTNAGLNRRRIPGRPGPVAGPRPGLRH